MYLAETKTECMWQVILAGRSKYDGIDQQQGRTVFYKTSRDANRNGDIRGSANRAYSTSQKRCNRRNNYLRHTVRPSFGQFLSFVYFAWCKGSTYLVLLHGNILKETIEVYDIKVSINNEYMKIHVYQR